MDRKKETDRKTIRQSREAAALRANLLRRKARDKASALHPEKDKT